MLALFEFKQLKKYSTIASFSPVTIFAGQLQPCFLIQKYIFFNLKR